MLHSQNTFNFTYADSFLYFAQLALPHRLARVRCINVAWQDLLNYHEENMPRDMNF